MRVDLRLDDLRGRNQVASKLMNVKIPVEVNHKIRQVAEALKASKTEVVIALLNEGLEMSEGLLKRAQRRGKAAPVAHRRAKGTKSECSAKGCNRTAVAKGLCAKHYQSARRKKAK